jgi:FtsP/CotA-like multicopper oxidase with cupredoxin domain
MRIKTTHIQLKMLLGAVIFGLAGMSALGQTSSPAPPPCPRFPVGSVINEAPDLFSDDGQLRVNLSYQTTVDSNGNTLFCFMRRDGTQSPTLHVHPGDTIVFTLTNALPPPSSSAAATFSLSKRQAAIADADAAIVNAAKASPSAVACGDTTQNASSVNVHYHGTNTSPTCHSDEVIHTLINSGTTFQYQLHIPTNEPPGLYWYHPHVHGLAEAALQGGASGAIIVEGIGAFNPETEGLGERILLVRDNPVPGGPTPGGAVPSWDLSLNYIPIPFPNYPTPIMPMKPGEKQLWRVSNSTADSILDLQLLFNGVPQPLRVVGLDGVPTGSQDGTQTGKTIVKNHILLATAARAEFIVTAPTSSSVNAQLITLNIDTGPAGDSDPQRPLATIKVSRNAPAPPLTVQDSKTTKKYKQRWEPAMTCTPSITRTLYFSEVISDPNNPLSPTNFFITVDGATPTLFDPNNPPAIVTTQGACEDWIIQNRAPENHEFHQHQIHFLWLESNGVPVAPDDRQFLDMIQVPFWDGVSPTFPSVKVRMSFQGADIGDFVYHCHILGHEDNGMMAIERVLPPEEAGKSTKPGEGAKPVVAARPSAPAKPADSVFTVDTSLSSSAGSKGLDTVPATAKTGGEPKLK